MGHPGESSEERDGLGRDVRAEETAFAVDTHAAAAGGRDRKEKEEEIHKGEIMWWEKRSINTASSSKKKDRYMYPVASEGKWGGWWSSRVESRCNGPPV